MIIEKLKINGLLVFKPTIFEDNRGFFYESFNNEKYMEITRNYNFVQDNLSKSKYGTVRGLHYQVGDHAQGKLVQVIVGKVLDVAVDIRFGSPTFGKYASIELSDDNKMQFWIPPGFAHGFSVLSETAIFSYKCTALYNKESERSIIYNDNSIGIDWKVQEPIVSEKDLAASHLNKIGKDFLI